MWLLNEGFFRRISLMCLKFSRSLGAVKRLFNSVNVNNIDTIVNQFNI